jgi:putative transposase
VARWLKEQENIRISDDTGNKWLHRLGYRLVPRTRKKSTLPEAGQQTPATDVPAPAASTVRRESTSHAIGGTNLAPPPDLPHRRAYPSDLTDAEWEIYKEFFKKEIEHPSRIYDVREVINATLYVMRTGCQWRYLPHDFPPYNNVFNAFQRWERNGILEKIHEFTRDRLRKKSGREESPSLGIVDTQSVKTTEKGGSADMTERRK